MSLSFVKGDATAPQGARPRVIVHCCNNVGAWGAGFVLALSRRWPHVEDAYRAHAKSAPLVLGDVQFVQAEDGIVVANLIGQEGVGYGPDGLPPIRYSAIRDGLQRVASFAMGQRASVHMPRMGAGLAGGDWTRIEELVTDELVGRGLDVTVYDL